MFFIDAARSMLGSISVEQIVRPKEYPQIKISGLRGDYLTKDLQQIYKTSRVASYMFDKLSKHSVLFPAFFALEVAQMLETIVNSKTYHYIGRRSAANALAGLYECTWLKKTKEEDFPHRLDLSKLNNFFYTPLPHQQTFLETFERVGYQFSLNGCILDALAGSGKTLASLYMVECANVDHVIVVSPKNALGRVWGETLRTGMKVPPTFWSTDTNRPYNNEKYIVVHFEALDKARAIIESKKTAKFAVIVDESHHFNEIKSQRTKTLIELCHESRSEYILLQSGTPFKAIGAEIVPALFMIDPTFNEDMAERFKKVYAASAVEALKLLSTRLGRISHKVLKEEINLQPPISHSVGVKFDGADAFTLKNVVVEMKAFVTERKVYYKEREDIDHGVYKECINLHVATLRTSAEKAAFEEYQRDVKIIRKGDLRSALEEIVRSNQYERNQIMPKLPADKVKPFKEAKTIYKYVSLKIQGECLGRILGRRRLECSVAVAANIPYEQFIESTVKKTMIYTVYVEALKKATETLQRAGYKPMEVFADTNKNLASIIEKFEKDPEVNPLVATFHSLSTAVPLVMADVLVMIDTPFRDYIYTQTIARVVRIGMTTQVNVYVCQLDTGDEPNLSTRTIDILKWSQSQIELLSGVKSPFEITEKNLSVEALTLTGESIELIEDDIEAAFMKAYV